MDKTREYVVRESPRAKNVRLKLSARDGLIVVVPVGFDHRRIPGLLEKKGNGWIKRWREPRNSGSFSCPSRREKFRRESFCGRLAGSGVWIIDRRQRLGWRQ